MTRRVALLVLCLMSLAALGMEEVLLSVFLMNCILMILLFAPTDEQRDAKARNRTRRY